MMENQNPKLLFFGTDTFSVAVLDAMHQAGTKPDCIVTAPDRPQGRGLQMQSPAVKVWADEHHVRVLQPEKLDDAFIADIGTEWDLFLLASYGKIIRQNILNIPKHGTLNVHPSLLPLYRGASPIESTMRDDAKETGVTIMLMDDKVDHGPIVAQELVVFETWPPKPEVAHTLATLGGALLAETIPAWIAGDIDAQEQEHKLATNTQKITKQDGLIDLSGDGYQNFLKIQALTPWPGTFFFAHKNGKDVRVKITDAVFEDNTLKILRVIPEGKKEQSYETFSQSVDI